MGKSNRIKSERAEREAKVSLQNTGKKKSTPTWLYSLLTVVVAVFVLLTIVLSTVASSGVVMRMQKAIYSENYVIDGQMLTYMFNAQYKQFQEDNSANMSYFGLDTTKSLKKQTFGDKEKGGYEAYLLGEFDGTWYDYFMSQVEDQARQVLIYCEEANKRGIKLEEAEITEIDTSISVIEAMAAAYGYTTTNSYVAANYGKGVKLKDVRAAMELSSLAAKCAEIISEEVLEGIEDTEIDARYNEKKKDYNVIDYVAYTTTVSYTTLAKELIDGYDGKKELTAEQKATVLEAYKKKIQEAKDDAEAFKSYKTPMEFFDAMLNKIANKAFDDYYKSEALKDEDKLSEDALKAVKEAMIKKVIEEVKAEEDAPSDDTVEKDGKYTAYEQTVTKNAAAAIDSIKEDLYTRLRSTSESYNVEKAKYNEKDEFLKWAFEDGRAANEFKVVSDGDGSEEGEITNKDGYFDITIYMIAKPEYCDKTLSKNVAYMTFSTENAAKEAIELFKQNGKFDKEGFEAVATTKNAASNGVLENYLEGQLTYNGFEKWLYDDARKIGDYSETALPNATSNPSEYAVFFYFGDGDEAWFIDVQNSIYAEDYEAVYKDLEKAFPVTVKANVVSKLDV